MQRTLCAQQTRSTSRSGSPRDAAGLWVAVLPPSSRSGSWSEPQFLVPGPPTSAGSVPGTPCKGPRALVNQPSVPGGMRPVHTPVPPPTPDRPRGRSRAFRRWDASESCLLGAAVLPGVGHFGKRGKAGPSTRPGPGGRRPRPGVVSFKLGLLLRVGRSTSFRIVEPVVTTSENPLRRQPRPLLSRRWALHSGAVLRQERLARHSVQDKTKPREGCGAGITTRSQQPGREP